MLTRLFKVIWEQSTSRGRDSVLVWRRCDKLGHLLPVLWMTSCFCIFYPMAALRTLPQQPHCSAVNGLTPLLISKVVSCPRRRLAPRLEETIM